MPAADLTVRNFNSLVTETSQIRDVSKFMPTLREDPAPLYALTNGSGKRTVAVHNPKIEFFDDADLSTLTAADATGYAAGVGVITVVDATLFGVRDMVQSFSANNSATIEEIMLVTAVNVGANQITVTRGFAGTTAAAIAANGALKILGSAQTETGAINNPRTPPRQAKTSGCQIFEWPMAVSRTAASVEVYGKFGERDRQHYLGMRRQRLEMENAGLFGSYSETLAGANSFYTSQGVRSVIATNVKDAGGTPTYANFLGWAQQVFTFSSSDRLLIASPTLKSQLDFFASNKQLTHTEDKAFGISLKRFVTANGTFMIVNNFNMDGGQADEGLAVDMSAIEFCYLENNGISMNTKLYKDYDPTNPKLIKDLLLTQAGWRVHLEARHGRYYDVTTIG